MTSDEIKFLIAASTILCIPEKTVRLIYKHKYDNLRFSFEGLHIREWEFFISNTQECECECEYTFAFSMWRLEKAFSSVP